MLIIKYVIMCGGNYPQFEKHKQLLKVNGEVLVERTIRLLKENGIKDIAICTNCHEFDYLGLPILMQENEYVAGSDNENKKSECSWLNAYYPLEEPACYLHGDVYFSEEAIQKIIKTPVKETMFFCTFDWTDGVKDRRNYKGREPFAYKVENQSVFRSAINDILKMIDEGKFANGLPPICWHLYRYLNGYGLVPNAKKWTEVNNIFGHEGDYVVINDYTTDIDKPEDVKVLEEWLKK